MQNGLNKINLNSLNIGPNEIPDDGLIDWSKPCKEIDTSD